MAAKQQDHAVLRKRGKRLEDGIGVGRLGIVDIADTVELAARLDAMLQRGEDFEALANTDRGGAASKGRSRGRERIDHVMVTKDLELARTHQRRLIVRQTHRKDAVAHKGRVSGARILKGDTQHAPA